MLQPSIGPGVGTNRLFQFGLIHFVNVRVTQVYFEAHHKKVISWKHRVEGVVGTIDDVV